MKQNYKTQINTICAVCCNDEAHSDNAKKLAQQLMLPYISSDDPLYQTADYVLCYRQQQLYLLCQQHTSFAPFSVDFTQGRIAHRLQHDLNSKQPLARAVGIKPSIRPSVLDITAGFAEDASILACLGCKIILIERQPIVWALLNDGLQRAHKHGCTWAQHINLHYDDALNYCKKLLQNDAEKPDVIYYDPMFPKNNKHAKVQKPMQILQMILGNDDADHAAFNCARQLAKQRVVVKRPQHAAPLFDEKPDLQIMMVKHRFDVYLTSVLDKC